MPVSTRITGHYEIVKSQVRRNEERQAKRDDNRKVKKFSFIPKSEKQAIAKAGVERAERRIIRSVGFDHNFIDYNAINFQALEGSRVKSHERRTLLSCTENPYTVAQWLDICERQDNKCACCGDDAPLTVDYIIPVSRGGRNSIDNIQGLCRPCNSSKGTKKTDYRKPN